MTLVKDDKSSKSSKKTIKKSTLSKPKPVKTIIRKDVTESVETTIEVEMCSAEAEMVTDLEDKEEEVVLCSAPSVPQPVVQSRRRPLLGPSPA